MSDQYVPALHQRFVEDMRIKGLLAKTQTMYLRAMRDFTRFLGRSPDTATSEDLRAFQLDMKERGVGAPTFNNRLTVLSFFFATTCPRPEMKRHMRYQRAAKKIPVVLSAEEVARILEAAPGPGLRYRAAFSVAYGGGLRASEVTHLKVGDIDSDPLPMGWTPRHGITVPRYAKCGHHHIAYISCKNRHCPKCQGPAARDWMAARAEDLLPVEYFRVVFTLPAEIARIAYWNKRAIYGLLFKASAKTVMTIAADPKRLGARVGITSVLHTWGSALTHHPHIHMIVPGDGLSPDGTRWVASRPGFFLHVRVLSRLFRRLFLEGLMALHRAGKLNFFGDLKGLAGAGAFATWLAPFHKIEWVVYANRLLAGPDAVLAYLSRYTHRVAISNTRLVSADADTVTFRWKDYRIKNGDRQKVMRLDTDEFIRRFLIHVLPDGFHRIRHYGLLASAQRKANIARARCLLGAEQPQQEQQTDAEIILLTLREPCPCCGGPMRIIEIFRRGWKPMSRAPPREQAA